MRAIITTQVYPPETHPSALMVRELAEHLVAEGWSVTVCAGLPHHPTGIPFNGWHAWSRTTEHGIEVLRAGHFTHPSRRIFVRGTVFLSQAAASAFAAAMARRAEVIVVYGPPLVGPFLGALLKLRHRAKLANVIYDIYPDVAIETGRVKNRPILAAARVVERIQYQASDLTIVLSEGFKRTLVGKGVCADKISVIPVWLDPNEIQPMPHTNAWRNEQGIDEDKFVVLYAGTIGIVSGAEVIAEAAAILRSREDILFAVVGQGDALPGLRKQVEALGLNNVRLIPFQPRARLSEVQATASVGLVTLAAGRGRTSVPSKILGYMAAGRPVVASVDADSDTATAVLGAEAGVVTAPGDARALAAALRELADDPARCRKLGTAAREAFVDNHSRDALLKTYTQALTNTIESEP